jgi:hypothetical protein
MFELVLKLLQSGVHRRVHRLKVTALLIVAGAALMLVAAGFGLALLNLWLQQLYGIMIAYAIIGGGCAAAGLILCAVALWRPGGHPRSVPAAAAAPEIDAARRSFEEAIAAVRHGSRETMLAALALAVVAGLTLGHRR